MLPARTPPPCSYPRTAALPPQGALRAPLPFPVPRAPREPPRRTPPPAATPPKRGGRTLYPDRAAPPLLNGPTAARRVLRPKPCPSQDPGPPPLPCPIRPG